MISNMFEITLDPLLDGKPIQNKGKSSEFSEQKYELIYSDRENINLRGPYEKDNLYPIPSLNQFISRKEKEKIITIQLITLVVYEKMPKLLPKKLEVIGK